MQKPTEIVVTLQIFRFLGAGGIAACANYGSRFIFSQWTNFETAIVLAYIVGMTVAFILMRNHVFAASNRELAPQIYKFIGINILAVLQTLIVSVVLAYWVLPFMGIVRHAEALAHLVGVLVPVITSYYGHKYMTFR